MSQIIAETVKNEISKAILACSYLGASALGHQRAGEAGHCQGFCKLWPRALGWRRPRGGDH